MSATSGLRPHTAVAARVRERARAVAGGTERARIVSLLAAVLALQAADTSTVGANSALIERGLHISHTEVGLLVSVALIVSALATVPIGVLADRVTRTRLLSAGVAAWSLAVVACGAAPSYESLLGARALLGAFGAVAFPVVASLTGDYFKPGERARIWGLILAGELVGAGFGFLISGNVGGLFGWRAGFWVLAPPGLLLAWLLERRLREPARGGQEPSGGGQAEEARRTLQRLPVGKAIRLVLAVPTNRALILASALGYFFSAGQQTFGVEFMRLRYGLSQSLATTALVLLGGSLVVGVLLGGRVADRLKAAGRRDARMIVPGVCLLLAAVLLAAGIVVPTLGLAALLFIPAGIALQASNPPLDAARLDVMPAALWGRAEGVRTLLRTGAMGLAPVAFGLAVDLFGGAGAHEHERGLQGAFLIMLVPLALGGAVLLVRRRSYVADAANAHGDALVSAGRSPTGRRRRDTRRVGRAAGSEGVDVQGAV